MNVSVSQCFHGFILIAFEFTAVLYFVFKNLSDDYSHKLLFKNFSYAGNMPCLMPIAINSFK